MRRATSRATTMHMRALSVWIVCSGMAFSGLGCGGLDRSASLDGGPDGGAADSATPFDSALDAAACSDPAACSLVNGRFGCLGATAPGNLCDFLATPCVVHPPDCVALGSSLGLPASLASCGNGLSFCVVNQAVKVTQATLDRFCAARATFGQSVDCELN